MKKIIIAAVPKNNVIGSKGKIPWHSKEEFKHFKLTTSGYPILMGRNTFESLGKPLKNRLNIIKFELAREESVLDVSVVVAVGARDDADE